MGRSLYLVLLCLILNNCTSKVRHEKIIGHRLEIPIPHHCLNTYISQDFLYQNDSIFYIGYNYINHSLDVYNLTGKKFLKSIQLQKEGVEGISNLNSFSAISLTSFFVANQFEFALIDSLGNKSQKFSINDLELDSITYNTFIDIRSQNKLIHDTQIEKAYVFIREKADYSSYSFFSYPIIGEVDLINLKLKHLPIFFPELYKNDFFGDLSFPYINSSKEYNILSFPTTEVIYLLEKETWGIEKTLGCIERKISMPINRKNFENKQYRIDYLYNTTQFGKIHLIETLNIFCRVHVYDYNLDNTPKRRIEFYDWNLNEINNFELEPNHAINFFVFRDNIYINRMNEKESHLIFDQIPVSQL